MENFNEQIKDAFLGCTVTFSEIANDKMKITTFELFEIVVKRLVKSAYDEGQKDAIEKCIEQLNVKIN